MAGHLRAFGVLVMSAAIALIAATPANATITCSYDAGTLNGVLFVQMSESGDALELTVGSAPELEVIDRSLNSNLGCPGAGGPATVTNTDVVIVNDNSDNPATPATTDGEVSVKVFRPAYFAPGKTLESGSASFSEIEIQVNFGAGMGDTLEVRGDDPPSTWRLGNGGLDWNAQTPDPVPDADITSQGAELVLLAGADNDDAIGAQGGPGVGAPFTVAPLQISGGPGDDTLEGGDSTTAFLAPGDTLIGDEGDDTLRGFAGDDRLDQGSGDDTMVGGVGTDSVEFSDAPAGVTVDLGRTTQQNTGDGLDAISEVEQVYGSEASDTLIGNGGPNHLAGRGGDDTLDGRASADSLVGGAGTDVVSFEEAPTGVVADLTAGTATGGAGADSLVDFENIVGSPFADTLTGNALDNSIVGLGGTDSISALAGADTVDVRDGEPDIASCGSDLDTATADLQTLDTVDADCETVDFLRDEAIELTRHRQGQAADRPAACRRRPGGLPAGGVHGDGQRGRQDPRCADA